MCVIYIDKKSGELCHESLIDQKSLAPPSCDCDRWDLWSEAAMNKPNVFTKL